MAPSHRLETMLRLRTRRRALAADELARRAAEIAALDRELAATRTAEAAARAVPGEASAATLLVAFSHADALARRAREFLDARACALTTADGARDVLRARRRDEQQLVRLLARRAARTVARLARERDRALDELALRSCGRRPSQGRRS